MKLTKKTVLIGLFGLSMFAIAAAPVLAVDLGTGPETEYLQTVQTESDYGDTNLIATIGRIIKIVLGFLGLICLILFIVGGFKWMVSGGNEEKISEAKKLMSAAVVGLFIIVIAYAATNFILGKLTEVTEGCTDGTVKCVNANPGKYVTCSNGNWGTTQSDCPGATTCILGDIDATFNDICGQQ